uniref:Uncharacterized protein n=1 Tax=Anguilla anguilla TaxID=7936 RepID=A0A0E9TLL7_ANGAN
MPLHAIETGDEYRPLRVSLACETTYLHSTLV